MKIDLNIVNSACLKERELRGFFCEVITPVIIV